MSLQNQAVRNTEAAPVRLDELVDAYLPYIGRSFGLDEIEALQYSYLTLNKMRTAYGVLGIEPLEVLASADAERKRQTWILPDTCNGRRLLDELAPNAAIYHSVRNPKSCAAGIYRRAVIDEEYRPNKRQNTVKANLRDEYKGDRRIKTPAGSDSSRNVVAIHRDQRRVSEDRSRENTASLIEIVNHVRRQLRPAEAQVIDLVLKGMKPAKIATERDIPIGTVRDYILRFHARCRAERKKRLRPIN